MKKPQLPKIQDLLGLVHRLFPPDLAEEWDNVGLQTGDPARPVSKVLVCLDVTLEAVEEAVRSGAQVVFSHHPLIFRPLRQVTSSDPVGRILMKAIENRVAIISAHTNMDRAVNGLNDWLAAMLSVKNTVPLSLSQGGDLVKLAVFVPAGYEEKVAEALYAGGAGQIGRYDRCSFRAQGLGTFRGEATTRPFVGTPGQEEQTREVRLETVLPRSLVNRVLPRMIKAHPYEEVAYDLYPLVNRRQDVGLGRIGRLAEPVALEDFAVQVKETLASATLRVVGDGRMKVSKVAVCGGSGASLLNEAARQGADVLVTGDIKYHEAQAALDRGVALIDAGHFPTESLMAHQSVVLLKEKTAQKQWNIEFTRLDGETDPFWGV